MLEPFFSSLFTQFFSTLCPALSLASVVRNLRCLPGEMVVGVVEVNQA